MVYSICNRHLTSQHNLLLQTPETPAGHNILTICFGRACSIDTWRCDETGRVGVIQVCASATTVISSLKCESNCSLFSLETCFFPLDRDHCADWHHSFELTPVWRENDGKTCTCAARIRRTLSGAPHHSIVSKKRKTKIRNISFSSWDS